MRLWNYRIVANQISTAIFYQLLNRIHQHFKRRHEQFRDKLKQSDYKLSKRLINKKLIRRQVL